MNNTSDFGEIDEIGDFCNTNETCVLQSKKQVVPINIYPFLGATLIVLSTALSCVGAYYLFAN